MNIHFLKNLKELKRFYLGLSSILFSSFLIYVISGIKILNPSDTNWLSIGDGTTEISWEFFRREPVFQFPFGKNPNYGLEISSTMAYDGQIPLMSIFFKLFNFILPERFQYFGIFIFLTFALNFYFASKIFHTFRLTKTQIVVNSILISMSPVILNRFVENTHYALTSAWLIFWAIYLCLKNNYSFISWFLLFNIVIFIHFYFMPFVLIIYFLHNLQRVFRKEVNLITLILQSISIIFSTLSMMVFVGYFYNQSSSQDVGFGIYRSTLTSLIDSSGWSIFIPDLNESSGAYEGFSFIGLSGIILIATYLITRKFEDRKSQIEHQNFRILWASSIILYIFSLSNKISFGTYLLFEYPIPRKLEIFTNTFRSSGRFSWLLIFILFIYLTYKVSFKLSSKNYSIFLLTVLIIFIFDIHRQLISQKEIKFQNFKANTLIDNTWKDIGKCYKNIRFFPPVVSIDNLYDFLILANSQNLGINSARLARFNSVIQNQEMNRMQKMIESGTYSKDSFYIFNTSPFVDVNFVNLYKELSIRTLNIKDTWGVIDNYQFIAPQLANCETENTIKDKVKSIGTERKYLYDGENLFFGTKQNNDKYTLIGFGEIFEEGVMANISNSEIILNPIENFNPSELILGRTKADNQKEIGNIYISVNNSTPMLCNLDKDSNTCSLKLTEDLEGNIIRITFLNAKSQFILTSLKLV